MNCLISVVTFGFDRAQYSVLENASFVTVTIRQISGGPLNRNVLITLATGDGTAICKCYNHTRYNHSSPWNHSYTYY